MLFTLKKWMRWTSNTLFFLTKTQKKQFNTIKYVNIEDYKTWTIYSIVLPLAAYIFAFLVNLIYLLNHPCELTIKNIFSTFNNGSLPIIAFGIVSSGIPYLMEVIENTAVSKWDIISNLRKKVMAVSVVFLFLTSALYILQSMNRNLIYISGVQEVVIFAVTLFILILACSTGGKMFLLQKSTIINDSEYSLRDRSLVMSEGLTQQFDHHE